MMYPIHQKNRAILSVSAARSVKQASLFATEEEWLASVITQLGGEYPHRLMTLTRDIMTACDEADRQLNLESGSIAHDVLTEAQKTYAATDAVCCLHLYRKFLEMAETRNYTIINNDFSKQVNE